jgi:NAD(P)H-hydrate repair Nnr-like enzyme with NAD(P)H-hydrate dehydratase domain
MRKQNSDIDRASDVPNCSVTSYQFNPAVGKFGQLELRLVNFVVPSARSRRTGHCRAGYIRRRQTVSRRCTIPSDTAVKLNVELLRQWPLPMPSADGDKEARGRVLVIGGSREMPGAVILAANAALRAGAGKLTVATGASVAQLVASAIPESRVIGLPETEDGGIARSAADLFDKLVGKIDAILIGPGMQDEVNLCLRACSCCRNFLTQKLCWMRAQWLSCEAASRIRKMSSIRRDANLILTPHAGEMAHLLGEEKSRSWKIRHHRT